MWNWEPLAIDRPPALTAARAAAAPDAVGARAADAERAGARLNPREQLCAQAAAAALLPQAVCARWAAAEGTTGSRTRRRRG